jgi:hypothetical protein
LRVETKLGGGDPVIEKKLNWCVVSAVIIHESTGLACSDGGMASQIAEMIGAAFNDGFRNFPTHSHGDRALSLSLFRAASRWEHTGLDSGSHVSQLLIATLYMEEQIR